jgi:hypothetical protein
MNNNGNEQTIFSMIDRQGQVLALPQLFLQIRHDFLRSTVEIFDIMVRHPNNKEPHVEDSLSLAEWNFALIGAVRSARFPQIGDEAMKGTRRTVHDECAGAIV